ncbi:type IV pilus assembly protein PilC [Desulfitispora alkaliphila]|uniref:type II secretion system F family protein n=1 Tax=Desulfitispora alkaliphila TaxID=622674 RepID=UPI003D194980
MSPNYKYKARTYTGAIVEDTIESESREAAIQALRSQKLLVINIQEHKSPLWDLENLKAMLQKKMKIKELVIFSRQFATMINAGIPLLRSMKILMEQTENQGVKNSMEAVARDLERGSTLSETMGKHPQVFPKMYVSMVEAGETGGALDQVLERLANYYEKEEEIRSKIKSAMAYPGIIFAVAVLAVVFLLVFVLPTFSEMLIDMNVEMPLLTQVLINFGDSLSKWWYLYLIALLGLTALISYAKKTPGVNYLWDKYMLRIPVYGNLQKKVLISRFSRTLGTLLRSGVPIIEALDVVKRTVGNQIMSQALEKAKDSIRDGQGVSEPLKDTGIFPLMTINMIAVGEETGELDNMLEKVSFYYDREVDTTISRLSASIEPIMMVAIGVVMGGIVLSIMLPMAQLYGSF